MEWFKRLQIFFIYLTFMVYTSCESLDSNQELNEKGSEVNEQSISKTSTLARNLILPSEFQTLSPVTTKETVNRVMNKFVSGLEKKRSEVYNAKFYSRDTKP